MRKVYAAGPYHEPVNPPGTVALLLLHGWALAARAATGGCDGLSFKAPARYTVSADEVVRLADLDGDSAPEVIASGNHVDQRDAFALLPNRGDGTLGSERRVPTGFGETLEEVTDLDSDGVPDLLASGYWQNGIVTYRATGPLQFELRTPFDTATHGGPTRAIDSDGDRRIDLVSFSFGSGNPVRVHVFRGRGDGTFAPKTTFETSLAVAAGPSTRVRNGTLEIVAAERSGHLGLFRFDGGAVSVSRLEAGPGFDLNAIFADVDEDGVADVVDTNDGAGAEALNPFEWIFVSLGTPGGGFLERKQLPHPRRMALPTELRVADLDGDGHLDLIAADFRATAVHVFRGRGTGEFLASRAIDAGGPVNDLATADMNRDGLLDLVTVNDDHSVSVVLNQGDCAPARRRAVRH